MQQHETAARRQIVVGVDGSPGSQHALRWAGRLAQLLSADVVVVHAVGLLEERHEPGTSAAARRAELRKLVEHEWCAPLTTADCPHQVEVRDGSPVDVLLGVAATSGASLVVTGCRGVGDNTALALGSTSLKLLQAARLPVLVVPEPDRGARPVAGDGGLDVVMVGFDRSPAALVALWVATDLAALSGASLAVVEVLESVPTFPLGPSTTEASAGEESAADRAQSFLDEQAAAIGARGVEVRTFVRTGEPAGALLDLADELDATLVAVGTRGRGGVDELLLGSVARTVADRARRPTLVVPDPERSD